MMVVDARRPKRLVPGVASRVSFDPEFALDAELSRDGRRLAFVAGTGTAMQLHVMDPGSDRPRPIAASVPGFHRWPRWSADGRRIALSADSRIYEVSVDDGASRVLVEPDSGTAYVAFPAWSPNGREIAYVQDGSVLVRSLEGGPARRLASTPNVPHSLEWSPDGRFIALVSGNTEFVMGTHPWVSIANVGNAGPSSVWIVPAAGGPVTRITDGLSLNTSPVWLPGSRALLFISSRDGGRDVYRTDLDGDGKPIGEAQRVTTGLGAHTISISADARTLAYSVFRLVANIWSVTAPDSGDRAVGEATPVTRGTQSVEGLALSVDGRWLAFDSDRHDRHHIYVVPSDGGEAKQITTGAADEFMPHWSPDASEIAYHAFTREAARRLQVVSATGGAVAGVTGTPRNQRRPSWSPDGSALVFDVGETGSGGDLYLIERTTAGAWGTPRRLTTDGVTARWSPDGRHILYLRRDGIWVTTRDGGAGRRVLRIDATVQPRLGNAEWSADGATILFKRYDGEGRTSFWSVPLAGGTPRLLVRLDRELRSHRPEFATDGRRFFFTVTERVSDIWTMALTESR
jgi:Tol biopolymer transport system component